MTFPAAAVILDTFNRASNGLGDNWGTVTGYETLHVVNDNSAGALDAGSAFNYWSAKEFDAHQEVYAVVAIAGRDLWLGFRLQTPGASPDGYRVECRHIGGAVYAYLVRVNTEIEIGSRISMGITALAAGDAVGVDANGSTITLYYMASGGAWASVGSWTDSTISDGGYIGLGVGGWPRKLYVPTHSGGVYYTSDFTAPDDATQPTWTAVNDGLATVYVRAMECDPFNRAGRQICLTCSANLLQDCPSAVVHIRYGTGSWASILTEAQARTLTNDSNAVIDWATVDRGTSGRIWVTGRTTGAGIFNGPFYYFYTDDDGETWDYYQSVTAITYYGGNLIADGDTLWHGRCTSAGSGSRVALSTNGGVSFAQGPAFTNGSFIPYVTLNPLEPTRCYVQGRGGSNGSLGLVDLAYVTTSSLEQNVLRDGDDLGVQLPQWLWFSQASANYQRLVKNNIIYTTLDGWTTIETAPAAKSLNVNMMLAPYAYNEEWIIMGTRTLLLAQNHIIYTTVGDDGELTGKAGSDPVGGTNSIPRAAGGVCLSGIEVVG